MIVTLILCQFNTGPKPYIIQTPTDTKIVLKHHSISDFKTIDYCWVTNHVSIYSNEQVDKKAKESLTQEETDFKNPFYHDVIVFPH